MRKGTGLVLLWSLGFATACGPRVFRPQLHDPSQLATRSPGPLPLKVHLRSGEMLLLDSWSLEAEGTTLRGTGTRYSVRRDSVVSGPLSASRDEIALLETTDRKAVANLATAGLMTLTVVYGVLSGICLADPKSCFGSCPTFYAGDGEGRPLAEGFSRSVARALEARDVDALPALDASAGRVTLEMRNEAQETHAVRRVRLLAVARTPGARVFGSREGAFHELHATRAPSRLRGPGGRLSGRPCP